MRTVALYGNSLVLSIVAASLEGRAGLRVLPADQLGSTRPDVAVFDLASSDPEFAAALRRVDPGLLCIGVDLAADRALIFSGQPSRVLTVEDLVNVIESASKQGEHPA